MFFIIPEKNFSVDGIAAGNIDVDFSPGWKHDTI
jgi:hypothetical protein